MLELIVLGTGSPSFVGPSRAGPAALILWQPPDATAPTLYLVDAGRWVTLRLSETGLDWVHIEAVLITHQHMDHVVGWSDLSMTAWLMGREEYWRVYGPPPTAEFCRLEAEAFSYDRHRRGRRVMDGALAQVTEVVAPGIVLEEDGLRVTAAPVPHGRCEHSFAYRFDAGGRSIVVSGDCSPNEALVELARGADVLLHEVIHRPSLEQSFGRRRGASTDLQERIASIHTPSDEVGKLARRAGVKKLVLTHFIPPVFDAAELHRTVAADFEGEIVLARDLTRA